MQGDTTKRLLLIIVCFFAIANEAAAYDLWQWSKARVASGPPALPATTVTFRVETIAEELQSPWSIVFAPDGRTFITERPGRLRVIRDGKLEPDPVKGVPAVSYRGQGGLLDIALHPDYRTNRLVYLAYSTVTDWGDMTRVARFKDTPEGLVDMEVIFPGFPGTGKPKHFGSRIRFGPDGKLYVTLGERGDGKRAQNLMDLNGKTLRLNDDGSVPEDNPFAGRADARPEIFSYGHRNAQGMAIQPETGLIFQTEHGPSWNDAPGGGDEINLVEAGKNYGWPLIHHRETRNGMMSPVAEYTPAIAPSGATFYTGSAFPIWQGDLFFATLVGKSLYRLKLDGRRVVGQEVLLKGRFGRLRDVAQGPDGYLYFLTSETDAYGSGREGGDRLLRLVPVR